MPDSRKLSLAALVVAMLGFCLYLPSLANGFVNWDDVDYVTQNPALGQLGFFDYLQWSFTVWFSNNWHPLTWLSLGLDYALWGRESASGYHTTSALLHAANCAAVVLLAGALLRRGGFSAAASLGASAIVGALFAAHPLHVESVAWVSERKDVLYGFFFLTSLLAYLSYTQVSEGRRTRAYLLSLALFSLSILSKPMAVSLPIVLVILDAYPLGRLRAATALRIAVIEKLPFYAISIASGLVTIAAQRAGGALTAVELPLMERLLLAERALGFYLLKFVAPLELAPLYPLPEQFSPASLEFLVPLLAIVAISAAALLAIQRAPGVLAAWMCFGVTLIPALGIVQVGNQAAADRYMYLPMLAPLMLMGVLAARAFDAAGNSARIAVAAAALASLLLGASTVAQIGVWKDSVTLWGRVVQHYPKSTTARYNLGLGYQSRGDLARAEREWKQTLELEPGHKWACTELGNAASSRGDNEQAERYYRSAIANDPYFAIAYFNLALTLERVGKRKEANDHYRTFIRIAPPRYAAAVEHLRAKLAGL